jgi:ABC-2 type transport system permease protein
MIANVWLVAKREIRSQLAGRAIKVSFVIMVVLALGGTWAAGYFSGNMSDDETDGSGVKVAYVGAALPEGQTPPGIDLVPVGGEGEAETMLLDGQVEAVVSVGENGRTVVTAVDQTPENVVAAFTVTPEIRLLDPPKVPGALAYIGPVLSGILFFMLVMMFGQATASNTVVEKQTRVVEILLTAVPAKVLMAGKVLGNAVLALAQVVGLLVAVAIGTRLGGMANLLTLISPSLVWFLVLFAFGFVMYSSILAGAASTVSRLEDVGAAIAPITYLMMIPYILVVSMPWYGPVQTALSFIPFSSPMAMPGRILMGDVPWWQPAVALALLALTTWGAIVLGGKLYTNSLLRMGGRVKWKQALASSGR